MSDNPSASDPIIVAFDLDGHLIKTEEITPLVYYEMALQFCANDPHAQQLLRQKIGTDKDRMEWFVNHTSGKLLEEMNNMFEPQKPFDEEFNKQVHKEITNRVNTSFVFDGIIPMMKYLDNLQKQGVVELHIISISNFDRIKKSLEASNLSPFFPDLEKQIHGKGSFQNKADILRELGKGNLERTIHSGDGYGDAKSCQNVIGDNNVFFIGKSEDAHCVGDHKNKLRELTDSAGGVMTSNSFTLFKAVKDRIGEILDKDKEYANLTNIIKARGSYNKII